MAGDTNSNIFINIDTSQAMAQLRALEKELTALNRSLIVGTKTAAQAQSKFAQSLLHNVNATGQWSGQMVQMRTATEQFSSALDRSKLSLREYFRYGMASSKTFGRVFGKEFDTVSKLVEKRVKTLQSQYVQLGRNAQGAMEAMRFTPKQLNYNDVTTRLMTAIQKQQIYNKLLDDGATKLLNFGKNTQWAGRQLMVGFTVPLMLLGAQAIKTFKEIETQALRFRKVYGDLFTDPGETEKALGNIRKLADEYTKYGLKVADTIKMAADAAAAGNVGKQLERIVDQSNKLAVLGGVTQEAAYETTLSLQNAFKIRGTELNQTIDFLNAVENQTVVAIEDLTAAIPRVAPVVQQLGGDVKDLAFFMAAMQEGGISAEQGANALKSGLASLINPSKAAAKAAGELGINLKGIIEANQGNLRNIVVGFARSLEPLTDLQRAQIIEKIFGKYQFARISALLNNVSKEGTQAARVLDLANRSVEEMALLSQRELKMAEESPLNKFNKSVEKLRASLAPIGELFAKTLTPVFEFIGRLADKFNTLPDGIKKAIAIIIGVVGGIGPIFLMTFGLMANALANILKLFNMMRKGYQQLAYGSSDAALKTQYLSQEELENISITNALYSAHQNLSAAYKLEAASLAALSQQYGIAKGAMTNFAATNPGMFLPPGARGRFRGYNKGTDKVPGYANGIDSVPAMLTPGEAVIPEPQAKKNRPLIRAMIADKLPKFAGGRFPMFGAASTIDERAMATRAVATTIPSKRRAYEEFISDRMGGFVTVTVRSGAGDGKSASIRIREADLPAFRKIVDENEAHFASSERKGVGKVTGGQAGIPHSNDTEGKLYYQIKRKNYDLETDGTVMVGNARKSIIEEIATRMPKQSIARVQKIPKHVTAKKEAILASPQSAMVRDALADEMISLRAAIARGDVGISEKRLFQLLKLRPEEGETFETVVANIRSGKGGFASSHITPKSKIEGDDKWKLDNLMLDTNIVNEALKNTFSGPASRAIAEATLKQMQNMELNDSQKVLQWILRDRLKPGGFYDRDLTIKFDAPGYEDGTFSVPGPKGAGDIVPAMLAPGEAVIPADMASKHRPLISDIIRDRLPGHVDGFDPFADDWDSPKTPKGPKPPSIWDDPDPTPSSKSGGWTGNAGSWRDQPASTPSIWDDGDTKPASKSTRLRNAARSLITDKDINAVKNLAKESGRAAKETAIATKNSKAGQAVAKAATNAVNRLGERLMDDGDEVEKTTKRRIAANAENEKLTKAERKNLRQEKRMGFSNKMMMGTMAIGMPLTMLAGYQQQKAPESFLGRNFENIMVGSMIAGMLPLLNNKIGMILGPVAAVVGLYALYRAQLNGAIKEGLKFGQSLNNSAKRLDEFGQITGRFSATAIQDEKRRNRAAAITPYDRTFGREFLGGELGKQFKQEFLDATGEQTGFTMEQSAVVLANKLAGAVSQGVIDFRQAESIAVEIARSLGDTDLELNARANLRQILGPDGSDLTKNPLAIQTRMIINNQELGKSLMENIAATRKSVAGISGSERNQMLMAGGGGAAVGAIGAFKAINALKSAGLIAAGTGIGAPIAFGAIVTAVLGSVAMRAWQRGQENKIVGKTAGAYVGASTSSVESIQQGIDAIREFSDVQVSKLQTELQIAKTAEERLAIEQKIKDVQTQTDKDTAELAAKQYEIVQGIVASRGQIEDEKNRELFDKAIKTQTDERIKNLQGYQKTEALQLQSYMLTNQKFLSGKGFEFTGPVKGRQKDVASNEALIQAFRTNIEKLQQQITMEQGKTGGGDRNKINFYNQEIARLNNQIQTLTNTNQSLQNARVTSQYSPEALMTQLNVMINAGMTTDADAKAFLEWTAATGENPQVKLDIIAKIAGAETGRTLAILNAFATPEAKKIYYELIEKKKGQKDSQAQVEALNNAVEEYRSIAAEAGINMDKVLAETANKTADYFGEAADKTQDTYNERIQAFAKEKAFIDKTLDDKRWTKANKEQRKKILIELQEKAGGAGKNLTLDRAIANWDQLSKYDDTVEKKAIFSYSVIMDAQGTQDAIKLEVENAFREETKTPFALKLQQRDVYDKRLEEWVKKNAEKIKTIASKYRADTMDKLFEPGGVLGPPKVDPNADEDAGTKKDFGWLEDLAQRLKLFKETTFNALAPLKELERFFSKNAKTINNSLDDQVGVMRQLADVAPGIALSPEFIRVLESMDPEQFKMWAKDLFEFDKTTGRLKGVTQTFRNINEGFNTARIGEFIEKQNQSIRTTSLQIQAYDKLTAAGADASTAMKIVSDEALATAVASNKIVKEEIAAIISTAKAAQDLMDKLNLRQNLADKLSSIDTQRKALIAMRLAGVEAETASQFANDPRLANAIKNLAEQGGAAWAEATAKLKEYNTQQKELKKLIDATADQGTYEVTRLKMAQKYFEVQAQILDMQNRVSLGKLNKELEFQERVLEQLSLMQQEVTEKYIVPRELMIKQNNYALERLSYIEDNINEAYQKQIESVNKVYDINNKITNLEKARLGVVDALARGDISAAAVAVADARRTQAESQRDTIVGGLEDQKQFITLSLGKKQLEEQNKILQLEISQIQQYQIDNIEAARHATDLKIESLNREVTTIERIIELQKESILYFGMTKEQIDDAVTLLDLASEAGIDINSPTFLNNVLKGAKGDAEALSEALKQVGTDAIKALNDMQALRTGTIKAPTFTPTQQGDATPKSYSDAAAEEEARRRAAEEEARRRAYEEALKRAKDEEERRRIAEEEARRRAEEEARRKAEEEARRRAAEEEARRRAEQAALEALQADAEARQAEAEARQAVAEAEAMAAQSRYDASVANLESSLMSANLLANQANSIANGIVVLNKLIKEGRTSQANQMIATLNSQIAAAQGTSGGGGGVSPRFMNQVLAGGGMVKKPMYMAVGGVAKGLDTVPAMLRPGEFIVSKFGVDNFGTDKLRAINSGSYNGESVYNYNLNVNVQSDANAEDIAKAVMSKIKYIDSQRIRTQRIS